MTTRPDLSVVIAISERHDTMHVLVSQYASGLDKLHSAYELVLILDGEISDPR